MGIESGDEVFMMMGEKKRKEKKRKTFGVKTIFTDAGVMHFAVFTERHLYYKYKTGLQQFKVAC